MKPKRPHFRLLDDPKYRRARREYEALRTTGSTDCLIFSPLLRAAKDDAPSPSRAADEVGKGK